MMGEETVNESEQRLTDAWQAVHATGERTTRKRPITKYLIVAAVAMLAYFGVRYFGRDYSPADVVLGRARPVIIALDDIDSDLKLFEIKTTRGGEWTVPSTWLDEDYVLGPEYSLVSYLDYFEGSEIVEAKVFGDGSSIKIEGEEFVVAYRPERDGRKTRDEGAFLQLTLLRKSRIIEMKEKEGINAAALARAECIQAWERHLSILKVSDRYLLLRIRYGLRMLADDNDDALPSLENESPTDLLPPYLGDQEVTKIEDAKIWINPAIFGRARRDDDTLAGTTSPFADGSYLVTGWERIYESQGPASKKGS